MNGLGLLGFDPTSKDFKQKCKCAALLLAGVVGGCLCIKKHWGDAQGCPKTTSCSYLTGT
jgi:hypothetical protein